MSTRTASSKGTTNRQSSSKSSPPAGQARRGRSPSVERDENYDLISVLYHTLQGAETIGQYIQDAREAQDDELLEFLQQAQATYAKLGSRAKTLLAGRLEGAEAGELDEDEEDDEEEEED